jgi:ABC-2 type transport system permease protein
MQKMWNRLKIYWHIWFTIAKYAYEETFLNRWTNALFFIGKAIRFGMALFFLILLHNNIQKFAGYTTDQVMIFFLTYQAIDTLSQVFFRGVYLFSWQVRSGELDFYLSKPINPLFRILTGKPDIIDAVFFLPTTVVSIWLAMQLHIHVTLTSALVYALLMINGFLISTAFHILVICLGIVTTEVDNVVMLYRDTMALARFPVDVYAEPLRGILFFLLPIGLMVTVPAQFLLNLTPSSSLVLTLLIGGGFFFLSLWIWKISLKKYTSAGG